MKFQRRPQEPVSLNLTPLIDVVFLLLIFFMVSTTFEQKRELNLQLPESQHGEAAEVVASLLQIEVSGQGEVRLNGDKVTDLTGALTQYLAEQPVPEQVLVIADERARHGQVTRVLDALAGADLVEVSFQTRYTP